MSKWNFIKASEYCHKVIDGTHDSPKSTDIGKPLVTSKHIKGKEIDFENTYLISIEDFTNINKRSQVHQWDVIISMIGEYCGFCYIEKNEIIDYAIKNVGVFKTNDALNAKWLYYYLDSDIGKTYLSAIKNGSSQPYFTLGGLRSLPILVPPNKELQKKIVDFLSALDAKIELNNRIDAELESLAKTIYDYWFVQFDFPNADGKPYKSSGGEMVYVEEGNSDRAIPAGWEVKKLGKVLKTALGGTPSTKEPNYWLNGDIPWLNSGEISNFPIISSEKRVTQAGIDSSAALLLPKGSVVVSIVRYIRPSILAIDACANQSVLGIHESDKLLNSFIYPYLVSQVPRLMSLRTGAQQPHINKETIDTSLILIPQNDVLLSYYKIANPLFKEIIKIAFQNQQLTQLRDWLLPMLMNGQVSIK